MKTTRTIALLLTTMLMVFALPGCVKTATPTPEANAPVQATEVAATSAPTEAPTVAQEPQKLVIWTNLTAEAPQVVLTKQFNEIAAEMGVEVVMEAVPFKDMSPN